MTHTVFVWASSALQKTLILPKTSLTPVSGTASIKEIEMQETTKEPI